VLFRSEGAELGGIVDYLGTDYIVVDDNGEELTIIPLAGMTKVKISDFEELVDSGETGDETDIYEYYLGDLGYGVKDVDEEYFYYNNRMNPEGIERISSKDNENKGKEKFSIENDLSDTQQTVARKYEEIAEILKKEKPVEVVTDENGFDWYEAPITQEDTQSPVVAFSLSQSDPTLKYQTEEGNTYTSYSEALRNTNGSGIKIGVNTVNGFQELYSKSTNTNIDTQDGLINHLIKVGILSDKSYKENGKTHLIPEGRNFAKKRINAENIKDAFQKQLGIKSAKLKADSSIELNEELQRSKVTVTAKNGEQITVDANELNAPFSELKKKFDTQTIATALASDALQKEMSKKTEVIPTELVPENELQEKLINLLNKFGIKMLSIETYLKEYSKRNDLPPTARALADIANKLLKISLFNLSNST